jgi:hypothetical protein
MLRRLQPTSKTLVPGIEKHPELRRAFLAAYHAAARGCGLGCEQSKVVAKYQTLVAERAGKR